MNRPGLVAQLLSTGAPPPTGEHPLHTHTQVDRRRDPRPIPPDRRFASIHQAVEVLASGRPVIVLDDENRENEGDLVAVAELITPQVVHFMTQHGRGLLCMPVMHDIAERIGLELMVSGNSNLTSTNFTIPIDHRSCRTGISPSERVTTMKAVLDPSSKPEDFHRPGHVFPLIARDGGVLEREGHTEAAVDLAMLAGCAGAGVLCEVCSKDGENMANQDELFELATKFHLPVITIEDLVAYRTRTSNGHGRRYLRGDKPTVNGQLNLDQCAFSSTDLIQLEGFGRRQIREFWGKPLSPMLQEWIAEYEKVGHRSDFIWKWVRHGVSLTALSCVDSEYLEWICDVKVLGIMFDVLLDDVADCQGDGTLLDELIEMPFGRTWPNLLSIPKAQRKYAELAAEVWQEFRKQSENTPRFDSYRELWRYDFDQLLNSLRYSFLLNNQPELLNLTEHDLYLPHNMHMMISATLDLMCSSEFDSRELGTLREALWHAQAMARIGNLITTWEREVGEKDYTSGVFALALAQGNISLDLLRNAQGKQIETAIRHADAEGFFLQQWKQHRDWLRAHESDLNSVSLRALNTSMEQLLCLHLGSRGRK